MDSFHDTTTAAAGQTSLGDIRKVTSRLFFGVFLLPSTDLIRFFCAKVFRLTTASLNAFCSKIAVMGF